MRSFLQIRSQIEQIRSITDDAAGAIKRVGDTIREMDSITGMVSAAGEEQGAATQEIARNIEQAATGTAEVSQTIAGVSQAADATGQTATQILAAAAELGLQSEALRRQVSDFLAKLEAA